MKQILPFLLFFFLGNSVFGQSGGDFLFTGMYADAPDGFAIVVVNPLPGSTNFYFTDDEWTGASLNTTEGTITWTTPAGGVIPGTVVTFNNVDTASPSIAATNGTPGTIVKSGSMSISGANEAILAYVGSFQNPTTFIAAISNETISTNPGGLTLSGTNLDETNTIEFDLDEDSMTFDYTGSPCETPGMSAACITAILDESNWITDLGSANNTDITDQPTGGFSALPVELVSFIGKVKEQRVLLSWVTETEVNNSHFSIEKSTNGKDFQEIATEKGAGTTYESQSYNYTDERPINGINYYRLKQIDYDGQFAYSEITSVDFREDTDIILAPNPVKDRLNITNAEDWKGTVDLLIFAVNGQLVQRAQYDNPDHSISLNIQDLRAGMYHVQIISNNQTMTQRFVKN